MINNEYITKKMNILNRQFAEAINLKMMLWTFKVLFVVVILELFAIPFSWFIYKNYGFEFGMDPLLGSLTACWMLGQIGYWLLLILTLWDFRTGERLFRNTNVKRLECAALLSVLNGCLITYGTLLTDFSKSNTLKYFESRQLIWAAMAMLDGMITFFFWLGVSCLLARAIQLNKEQELTI